MPVLNDQGLLDLLAILERRGYRFVTPTPATHARVVARSDRQQARSLEDVLGWSLPFDAGLLDGEMMRALRAAGILRESGERLTSSLRVSSLHGRLFLHSSYPTTSENAVFFGPDSYRFADLIAVELTRNPCPAAARILDVGAGAGVGAIVAALACPNATVLATDVNPHALALARINAGHVGITMETREATGLAGIDGEFDVITANPPYIIDDVGRTYRDGGDMHGGRVSLDMASEAVAQLAPGGRLILYTGSAILGGRDPLQAALQDVAAGAGCTMHYREIDPDVFGEELDTPGYADVDRIALVAATITRCR